MRYLVVHLASYQHSQLSESAHSDPEDTEDEELIATPVLVMEVEAANEDAAITASAASFERYAPLGNVAVYEVGAGAPTVRACVRGEGITFTDAPE